jgi:hypothetical protein
MTDTDIIVLSIGLTGLALLAIYAVWINRKYPK